MYHLSKIQYMLEPGGYAYMIRVWCKTGLKTIVVRDNFQIETQSLCLHRLHLQAGMSAGGSKC